jgi:hypothetical protein
LPSVPGALRSQGFRCGAKANATSCRLTQSTTSKGIAVTITDDLDCTNQARLEAVRPSRQLTQTLDALRRDSTHVASNYFQLFACGLGPPLGGLGFPTKLFLHRLVDVDGVRLV